VQFRVFDAESGKPIAGAKVETYYLYVLDPFAPKTASAVTNDHGEAEMKVAVHFPREIDASADGFIAFRSPPGPPAPDKVFNLWLYRLPQPTVEIVVPNGYRGRLDIVWERSNSLIQEEPGKRRFVFHASANGIAQVKASPLLLDDQLFVFAGTSGRYENGAPIPQADYRVGPNDIALRWIDVRWVDNGDHRTIYVVGTKSDEDQYRLASGHLD